MVEYGRIIQGQSAPMRGTQHEQRCVDSLRQAIKNGDAKVKVNSLKDLGDVHLDKGKVRRHGWDFTRASALYNAALVRCKESQMRETLIHRIRYTEKLFLNRVAKVNKHDAVIYDYQTDLNHKAELSRIRDMCRKRLVSIGTMCDYSENPMELVAARERERWRAEAVRELYRDIMREIKGFIITLVEECFSVLGQLPCKYAMIGMGSFARQEMTPYSDLEFAILVEEGQGTEENKTYFRILTHLLHLKVLNLGETILPSMAIPYLNDFENQEHNWLYDSVTPRGFSFDGAMPWASKTPLGRGKTKKKAALELIMTPREMAELQTEERSVKEGYHLASVLSKVDLITGDGDILAIYDELVSQKLDEGYLNSNEITVGQYRASAHCFTLLDNFDLDKTVPTSGELYDVKQVVYRFLSMCFRHIGDLCGTAGKTLTDIIEELQKDGILTTFAAHNVRVAAAIADEIRLRAYCSYGRQREHMAIVKPLHTKTAMGQTQIIYSSSTLENTCTETKPGEKQQKDVASVSPHHVYHIDDSNLLHRFYMTVLPLQSILRVKWLQQRSDRESDVSVGGQLMRDVFTSQSLYGGALERGRAFRILQLYERAEECLRNALEKDPKDDDLVLELAVVLHTLDKYHDVQVLLHPVLNRMEQSIGDDTDSYSGLASKVQRFRIMQGIMSVARKFASGDLWQWVHRNVLAQVSSSSFMSKFDQAYMYSRIAFFSAVSGNREQSELSVHKALENLNLELNPPDKILDKMTQADALGQIAAAYRLLRYPPGQIIKYAQLAREIYIECVGADTPHTGVMCSMAFLDEANRKLGNWKKAIEWREQVLEMTSALGETQGVIESLSEMGYCYFHLGEEGKALELLQQAESLLPDTWYDLYAPIALHTIYTYGCALDTVGRVEEARQRFQRILDLPAKGRTDELLAKARSSYRLGLQQFGQIQIEYMMQSYSLYAHVFKNDHGHLEALRKAEVLHEAMSAACSKGLQELQFGKFGAAHQSFSDALEVSDSLGNDVRRAFPTESESITKDRLYALMFKASCLFRLSDIQGATAVYTEAVDTFRDFYGQDAYHPILACFLAARGRLHDTQGDSETAKKCYSEVWEMITRGQTAGQSGYETILLALSFFCAPFDDPNSSSGMDVTALHLLMMPLPHKSFFHTRKAYGEK